MATVSVSVGRIAPFSVTPSAITGSQPSRMAKKCIRSSATKKFGRELPTKLPRRTTKSSREHKARRPASRAAPAFWCATADATPSGTDTATVSSTLVAANSKVAGSFDKKVSSTSRPDTKLLPISPVAMPPSQETYWTRKGLSSPSLARAASMTSWETAAPAPAYISVTASLPASRIREKDRNVIPKSTGAKERIRCKT